MTNYTINNNLAISYLIELILISNSVMILLLSLSVYYSQSNALELYSKALKVVAPLSFLSSFYLYLVVIYLYIYDTKWYSAFWSNETVHYDDFFLLPQSFSMTLDFFGLVLILLAYIVGFISLTCINDKLVWNNNKQPLIFSFFINVVILFVTCDYLFIFFLYYEFLLIPSFFIVYSASSNENSVMASLYFLVWTQTGSTIVLASLIALMQVSKVEYFSQLYLMGVFLPYVSKIKYMLFLGFGFKVPIWPLYYWLTKTHVEATGAFSIYLSGFLVKTAIYGLYKFLISTNWDSANTILFSFGVTGVVVSSLQMWSQVDLKKVVALCTVQEMNLLLICFVFGHTSLAYAGILFCFMHAMLSALMFFLVDLLQKRFGTRFLTRLSGIIHLCPNLGLSVIFMCLCFLALPFTLKFSCEFMLFSGVMDLTTTIFVLCCLITNWIAPIAFCKIWYSILFGIPNSKYSKVVDLEFKEIQIITVCILSLVLPCNLSLGLV